MVQLTYSLSYWLATKYPKVMPLISFGHIELFTAEMQNEYLKWCSTAEGKRYLVGGDKYESHMQNKESLNDKRQ